MSSVNNQYSSVLSKENLLQILERRATQTPDKTAFTFLKDGQDIDGSYTYSQLDLHARAIAKSMGDGAVNERALLIYPPGVEFVAGFYGAMYSGSIPIPAPPPDIARLKRTLPRLKSIIDDAQAKYILTTRSMMDSILGGDTDALSELSGLKWIVTDEVDPAEGLNWTLPVEKKFSDIAYLQYTSGSTSTPKGVMVTYGNVVHNCEHITTGFGYDGNCVMVTWMPYFHDYGLIDGLTLPLFHGFPCYIISPLTFIRRPERWLQAISTFRGTHTQAPNFAYELCVSKIEESVIDELDLSSMKTFSSGGEHIRVDTVRSFTSKFARCGLKPEAVCPAYGLAEGTLVVSAKTPIGLPYIKTIDSAAYKNDIIVEVDAQHENAWSLASSGRVFGSYQVAIVDPETRKRLPVDRVGEVWASGGSVCAGYWLREEESERTFRAVIVDEDPSVRYLRTGDLGFVDNGQLFITGRAKDLIIIDGANHYPQDVELTAQNADSAIRVDHCAAFSVDVDDRESLVIIAEAEKKNADWDEVLSAVQKAVSEVHELEIYALQIIKRGNIFKTSSGKLQRRACKEAFLNDEFDAVYTWVRKIPEKVVAKDSDSGLQTTGFASNSLQRRALLSRVKQLVSEELGVAQDKISDRRPLAELGMSSRKAVFLASRLEELTGGSELPTTFLWEHPTVEAIVDFLSNVQGAESEGVGRSESYEDVAVVGMACRFPGADDLGEYWENLLRQYDAITDIPAERWEAGKFYDSEAGKPGFINNTKGGFIRDIDRFDAAFFGLSPSEAAMMDPQQRLLMESTWHALENGNIQASSLDGSDTGVFVGISTNDYQELQLADRLALNPYTGPGKAYSIAANRLSYFYNFRGPSMAIDTACSSSLVAVHQAVQSLRRGECSTAIAGGVNAIITPTTSIALSQAQMLSPDGHCKTFDARANGYVRSEGVGMVVLKRVGEALRDGNRIYAVIKGSAVNQDGRSNGLTAPNAQAQKEVITKALNDSGVEPANVSYVEAHGTGTALGDPIEASSLMQVYGNGRNADQICHFGSVKTNIGHLEAAAGIAGLIKTSLALYHGIIPGIHGFETLNERINLDGTPFKIASSTIDWKNESRYAGISSFGFGGTNAHIILGNADSVPAGIDSVNPVRHVLAVSASSKESLKNLTDTHQKAIEKLSEVQLSDYCGQSIVGRTSLPIRTVITGANKNELLAKLRTGLSIDEAEHGALVWLFTGQGSQYTGMAKSLYESFPLFKNHLDHYDKLLSNYWKHSLINILWDEAFSAELSQTRFTQAAVFAIQMAKVELLKSFDVHPDVVAGYSVGEFTAACCAGIFSVEDGLMVLAERGRLVDEFGKPGGMVAVQLAESEAAKIASKIERLQVATINGAAGTVLAGPDKALNELEAYCTDHNIEARRLNVSHAFHTDLMEEVTGPFREVLSKITFNQTNTPVVSNLTGKLDDGRMSTTDYWVRHLLEPVRFGDSMATLFDMDMGVFLEIGPKPVLSGMASRFESGKACHWIPTLRQGQSDAEVLLDGVGKLWSLGALKSLKGLVSGESAQQFDLPLYPFEKTRYWLEPVKSTAKPLATSGFSLSGTMTESSLIKGKLFETELSLENHPYYKGHVVFGRYVVPAAGHLALLLEAARRIFKNQAVSVGNVLFPQPLVLSESTGSTVRLLVKDSGEFTLVDETRATVTLAVGTVSAAGDQTHNKQLGPPESSNPETDFYSKYWQKNIELGPEFRQIQSVSKKDTTVWATLGADINSKDGMHEFHPGFLDSVLQALTVVADVAPDEVLIPFSFENVTYLGKSTGVSHYVSEVTRTRSTTESVVSDVVVHAVSPSGTATISLKIDGFTARRVKKQALLKDLGSNSTLPAYNVEWMPFTGSIPFELLDAYKNERRLKSDDVLISQSRVVGFDADVALAGTDTRSSSGLTALAETLTKLAIKCRDNEQKLVVFSKNAVDHPDFTVVHSGMASVRALVRQIEKELLPGNCISVSVSDSSGSVIETVADSNSFLIDLPDSCAVLFGSGHNDFAVSGAKWFTPSLSSATIPAVPGSIKPISASGRYLVTGASGVLAKPVIQWLISKGAGEIDLLSRSSTDTLAAEFRIQMNGSGTRINSVVCDVTNENEVLNVVHDPQKSPVKGVFHLAGSLRDTLLQNITNDDFNAVLAPKVDGIRNLDACTSDLDYFVAFSSASSVLSTPGQANYAMANAFMDAFIAQRVRDGKVGLSLSWGPFSGGMAAGLESHFENQGIHLLGMEAFEGFESLVSQGAFRHVFIMDADWNTYSQLHDNPRLLSTLVNKSKAGQSTLATSNHQVSLNGVGTIGTLEQLEAEIRKQVAEFLHKSDPGSISSRKRLFEIGLDSLGAVELKNRLSRSLGKELRSTLLFDYPTIEDLTSHLSGLFEFDANQGNDKHHQPESLSSNGGAYGSETQDLQAIDDLSESELEELLRKELGED